jgi:hypothetical protein
MMALTMATALAGCALVIAQGQFGAGRHRGDVDPDIYMIGMKLNFISQPTYLFAICFVKLAVGFSLLRIASTKFYRYLIRGIMGFMLFYTIGCFFVSTFLSFLILVLFLLFPFVISNLLLDHHLSMHRHPRHMGPKHQVRLLGNEDPPRPVLHKRRPEHPHRPPLRRHHPHPHAVEPQRQSSHTSFPPRHPRLGRVRLRRGHRQGRLYRQLRKGGRFSVGLERYHHLDGGRDECRYRCG